jgi:hypothetical protein
MKKGLITVVVLFTFHCSLFTQNVGVNTTTPLSNLDIKGNLSVGSSYGGTIAAPTNGAIIQGNVGIATSSPADKLHVVGNLRLDAGRLPVHNTGYAVYVGENAGTTDAFSASTYNVGIGYYALNKTTSTANTASVGIGYLALQNQTSAIGNVAIGSNSLRYITGAYNTAVGYRAGTNDDGTTSAGINNTFIGAFTSNYTNGSSNTMLGYGAGYFNSGSGNVFLGKDAGGIETGSNRLYIDNSNTASPLIYGEFDNNKLKINGSLDITGGLVLPTTTKTASYILTSSDYCVIFTGSTASQTFTFPSSPTTGRVILIINHSSVALTTTGFLTSSSATPITSVAAASVTQLLYDGANWRKMN